jgi:hypothetical protein
MSPVVIAQDFSHQPPSHQNALDLFEGAWKSALPAAAGLTAGTSGTFDSTGVVDFVDRTIPGGLAGRSVLEIGPYEGYYTSQLEQRGVASVLAVEVNVRSYLKCLVVKEALGLQSTFLLGDALELDLSGKHYDLCFAGGVLEHQTEPLQLLAKVSAATDALYIWTHYYDPGLMDDQEDFPHFKPRRNSDRSAAGFSCRHHYRAYALGDQGVPATWSGGAAPYSNWLERDDIFAFVEHLGFQRIVIRQEVIDHPLGPHVSFLATR